MWKELLMRWVDLRRGNRIHALAMTFFFFLVMVIFWALKPMKRGLLISYHKEHALELLGTHLGGAQAEQLAKVANVFAALLLAIIFGSLSRRLAPRYIVLVFCALFVVAFLGFAGLMGNPGMGTVWSFYVVGDMFNTLMVTMFWTLMNDSVEAEDAKRLYGMVGLGGVAGGMIGATLVRSSVENLGRENVLLLCAVPIALIGIIGYLYGRHYETKRAKLTQRAGQSEEAPAAAGVSTVTGRSLFRGLHLLASSKYLLSIGLVVAFYEVASNIIDFQLSATAERYIASGLERDRFFASLGQAQSFLSIIVQLFLTNFVLRRFGVGSALLVLPAVMLCGAVGFLLLPTLSLAALMSVSDNSMNYSINQSAKEALYVPTTVEEKFQAKAFVDMFVQRLAKMVAVGLNLGLVAYVSMEQVRWLSLASVLVLALWVSKVRFAGRHFERLAGEHSVRTVNGPRHATAHSELFLHPRAEIASPTL
jgi:ATP:ADP antiporter, AAA family